MLHRRALSRHAPRLLGAALLGLVALALVLWGAHGSTKVVSQTRPVAPFSAVELAGSNLVSVHVGARQSVVVHARKDMLGRITTQVIAGALVISDTGQSTKGPMSVSVSVPSLRALAIGGSGTITVSGVATPSLTVAVGGSGVIRASGTAERLDVGVGGSGDVELGQLVARDARAEIGGSGQIVLTVTGRLDAGVSGHGVIRYSGNPQRVTTSVTGSGAIIPG